MKKITKTYELYEFKELEQEIKDKSIEKQAEQEYDFFCDNILYNEMLFLTEEKIKNNFNGAFDINIYYDLSYCQGSGTCSEFKISLADLQKKYNIFTKKDIKSIIEDSGDLEDILMIIKHSDNFYCHARSFVIEYSDFLYYNDLLLDIFEELEKKVKIDVIRINEDIEKEGYLILENDDYFKDMAKQFFEDNENLYLKNGEIFIG